MGDIISLLPDSIANQIAAGEVIQRPASVIKELMENSIDAGSTSIKLIIKDAGKTLLQVIDDGCGMSDQDARMCFERHATSKIKKAKDLFAIRTMGFRGEAMASIAAIAQVEMRTRRQIDELGVKIIIEGSVVKSQEPCQCMVGTSISVKNLFYNVPARRNFLKSDTVEMRHIVDEFQRIALAHSDLFFSLHHNNSEVFHLPAGNLRQRIVGMFGSNTNKKLVPISENTDALNMEGYVGKPSFAKKTRGEQFFFVNQRYIKSGYLNHAIMTAYEDLLPKDTFPLYVIFLEIDPARIDINVHPTKQEIKFEDERLVYNYLKVAVRHALGQYSITPTLDFEQEASMNALPGMNPGGFDQNRTEKRFENRSSAGNPSTNKGMSGSSPGSPSKLESSNLRNWQKLYEGLDELDENNPDATQQSVTIESAAGQNPELGSDQDTPLAALRVPYQIHGTYIVSQIKSGFILIDQRTAHKRILYERYLNDLQNNQQGVQQKLFTKTITVAPADKPLLDEILPQIQQLGFDIEDFGNNSYVIHGIPAELSKGLDEQKLIEDLLEQYKANIDLKMGLTENIALSLARGSAIKRGQNLTSEEMQGLIDKLFACQAPYKGPTGDHCFVTYELDDLKKRFAK